MLLNGLNRLWNESFVDTSYVKLSSSDLLKKNKALEKLPFVAFPPSFPPPAILVQYFYHVRTDRKFSFFC